MPHAYSHVNVNVTICVLAYIYKYIYVNELYYELCIVTMRLTKITIFATIRTRKAGMIKKENVNEKNMFEAHDTHNTRESKTLLAESHIMNYVYTRI